MSMTRSSSAAAVATQAALALVNRGDLAGGLAPAAAGTGEVSAGCCGGNEVESDAVGSVVTTCASTQIRTGPSGVYDRPTSRGPGPLPP